MHGLPRLSLVPKDIPAGQRHRRRGRFLRRERRRDAGGLRSKQRGAEERRVRTGAVVPALRRRRNVEELELRRRSARNEPVGVYCSRRRGVVVGVDQAVHVTERRRLGSRRGGRRNIEVTGG